MKRVMVALMVVVMVVSLVGCGGKISADVRNAMKEYESICDEYCAAAKKAADGNQIEAASDMLQILSKLSDVQARIEKLSEKNLNDEEKNYILEVQERCEKKVTDAMNSLKNP